MVAWQMTQEKRALEGFSEEPDETLGRCGRVPALIKVQQRSNRDREAGLRKSQWQWQLSLIKDQR